MIGQKESRMGTGYVLRRIAQTAGHHAEADDRTELHVDTTGQCFERRARRQTLGVVADRSRGIVPEQTEIADAQLVRPSATVRLAEIGRASCRERVCQYV